MQANAEHSQALDQLQKEINLILEHTGRFFASICKPSEQAARVSRLKQQVATSTDRYHEALDVLDYDLQFAKAVMRRDLAVVREKEGKQPEPKTTEAAKPDGVATTKQPEKTQQPNSAAVPPPKSEPTKATETSGSPLGKSPKKRPNDQPNEASADEPAMKKQAVGEDKPTTGQPKPADTDLQIDVNAQPPQQQEGQAEEEEMPDTGTFSNNADLDSLFNDPTSAGGADGSGNGEGTGFTDDAMNNDFDFSTFNTSLDNTQQGDLTDNADVSALLPGLQDYANDSANGEPDLGSFFQTDPPNNANEQSQPDAGQGGGDGGMFDDAMFGDLMNMDFDLGGGDENNGSVDHDFVFDQ